MESTWEYIEQLQTTDKGLYPDVKFGRGASSSSV
jgi:hypothetical protein